MKRFKIDYDNHPVLSEEELHSIYSEDAVLCLDEVLGSKECWYTVYQHMLDILKYGFERPEIRHRKIHFRIHEGDEKIHELEIRHFMGNLNLWYAFLESDSVDVMDESFILDFNVYTYADIIKYINTKIFDLLDIDIDTKGKIADEITFNIAATSRAFEDILGLGLSVYNIIQAAKQFPVIDEIMHEPIDTTLQPNEIESILNDRTDVIINALTKCDNDLRPLIVSGKNVSKGQFKEIAVRIGMKSDIEGHVIPYVADCNLLVNGFKDAGSFYISAKSGRKSLIFSKLFMGEPGAFSRKVCINTTDVQLRDDYQMCDSTAYVEYDIKSETFLEMLDKRYYYDENGELKLLDAKKDTHLIGNKIKFRSPCTCSSTEGICKYCYGELYEINKDLFSAGCYAATKETEYLGQGVLSTKHEQQTNSTPLDFPPEFNNDFEVISTEILLNTSDDDDSDKYLVFDEVFKEDDDEDVVNYYVYGFKVCDDAHKIMYEVSETNGLKLFMTPGTYNLYKKYSVKKNAAIPLEEFEDIDDAIFAVEIKSAETTEPTKILKKLLNNNDHSDCNTISDMCQKFAELKIQSGHPYNCVHHEMIIRGMIRKASNVYEFPDFGPNGDHDDYQILRIDSALYNNPSPMISLCHGHLKKQLLSPQFYEKTAPSHLDPLFAPVLADVLLDPKA